MPGSLGSRSTRWAPSSHIALSAFYTQALRKRRIVKEAGENGGLFPCGAPRRVRTIVSTLLLADPLAMLFEHFRYLRESSEKSVRSPRVIIRSPGFKVRAPGISSQTRDLKFSIRSPRSFTSLSLTLWLVARGRRQAPHSVVLVAASAVERWPHAWHLTVGSSFPPAALAMSPIAAAAPRTA